MNEHFYDADLAWDSPVVYAGLPKPPSVALDVAHHPLLVGKVHLPCQGPIPKDPHPEMEV